MRNLKKVLSLVLALAMVLSLCMAGAGAVNYDDFTDKESIAENKKQAVETLVSLDVIKGYNDGATFNPTGNVTRAEMATMICRVLAGGDKAIPEATKAVPTYNDIRNNPSAAWAETYIEYCTSLGIVSGKGNGIFDPMADVTAAEAAKMAMTALGYNADIEGFKGIGWDINVMAKASTLNLTENLVGEISANTPLTRQQVAQLLYNALTAYMVQGYNGTMANTWVGSGADAYHETLLESKFNAERFVGVVVANEFADLYGETPLAAGRTRLALMDANNDITSNDKVINLTTGQNDLGQSVVVFCDKTTSRVVFGNTQDTGLNKVQEFTNEMELTRGGDAPYTASELRDAEYFVNYAENLQNTGTVDHYFRIGFVSANKTDANKDGILDTQPTIATNATIDKNSNEILTYRVDDKLNETEYKALEGYINTLIAIENTVGTYTYTTDDVVTIKNNDYVPVFFEGRVDNTNAKEYTLRVEYNGFNGFARFYLTQVATENMLSIDKNGNGNYLKCVDANGDGDVDYVMQVIYTMAKVDSAKKDLLLTREVVSVTAEVDPKNPETIKADTLDAADEFSNGDVIVYFEADGIYHANLAQVVTGVPTSVDYKADVVTVDGETYTESDINIGFWCENQREPKTEAIDLNAWVDNMVREDETYNLYLDNYGYVRAWEEAVALKDLVLLTRANTYKGNTSSTSGYAVEAYNNEEGKILGYDLNTTKSAHKDFICQSNTSYTNDWDKLIGNSMVLRTATGAGEGKTTEIGYTGKTGVWNWPKDSNTRNPQGFVLDAGDIVSVTNVAAATITEDGKMTIRNVEDASNRDTIHTISLDNQDVVKSGMDARRLKTHQALLNDDKVPTTAGVEQGSVYTNNKTVYYLVTTTDDGAQRVVRSVRSYVGYGNIPEAVKAENITAMYAVATLVKSRDTDTSKDYYAANVVVIESNQSLRGNWDVSFVYDTHDGLTYSKTTVDKIKSDGTTSKDNLDARLGRWYNAIGFYREYNDGSVERIRIGEYNDAHIYAGTVTHQDKAEIILAETNSGTHYVNQDTVLGTNLSENTPIYTLSLKPADSTGGGYDNDNVDAQTKTFGELRNQEIQYKDIIWVTNSRGDVQYIINVTDSFYKAPARNVGVAPAMIGKANYVFNNDGEWKDNTLAAVPGYGDSIYNDHPVLIHLWSHINNDTIFAAYEQLVNAWKDWSTGKITDREFRNIVDSVDSKLGEIDVATHAKYTRAQLLADGTVLADCEVDILHNAGDKQEAELAALYALTDAAAERDQIADDAAEIAGESSGTSSTLALETLAIKGVDVDLSKAGTGANRTASVTLTYTQANGGSNIYAITLPSGSTATSTVLLNGTAKTGSDTDTLSNGDVVTVVLVEGEETVTYAIKVTVNATDNNTKVDSVKVKGQTATWNATTQKYEVTLSSVQAALNYMSNGVDKDAALVVKTNNPSAATTVKTGGAGIASTAAMDQFGAVTTGDVVITVTAEDTVATTDYTISITVTTVSTDAGFTAIPNKANVAGTVITIPAKQTITSKADLLKYVNADKDTWTATVTGNTITVTTTDAGKEPSEKTWTWAAEEIDLTIAAAPNDKGVTATASKITIPESMAGSVKVEDLYTFTPTGGTLTFHDTPATVKVESTPETVYAATPDTKASIKVTVSVGSTVYLTRTYSPAIETKVPTWAEIATAAKSAITNATTGANALKFYEVNMSDDTNVKGAIVTAVNGALATVSGVKEITAADCAIKSGPFSPPSQGAAAADKTYTVTLTSSADESDTTTTEVTISVQNVYDEAGVKGKAKTDIGTATTGLTTSTCADAATLIGKIETAIKAIPGVDASSVSVTLSVKDGAEVSGSTPTATGDYTYTFSFTYLKDVDGKEVTVTDEAGHGDINFAP